MNDLSSFRLALVLLCLESFCVGVAAAMGERMVSAFALAGCAFFAVIVWRNARDVLVLRDRVLRTLAELEQREQIRRFICTVRGCTQTDGKPCAYPACPNRGASK